MAEPKKYTVSGIGADGDVHVFLTDDIERAAGMKMQFDEDLEGVTFDGPPDMRERPSAH